MTTQFYFTKQTEGKVTYLTDTNTSRGLLFVESNQPTALLTIRVGKDAKFTKYNFKTKNDEGQYELATSLASNVLAVGGKVILSDGKTKVTIKNEDEEAIEFHQLEQLEYLVGKYPRVSGYYGELEAKLFGDVTQAKMKLNGKAFFSSTEWGKQKQVVRFKTNYLDKMLDAFAAFEQDTVLEIMSYHEQVRRNILRDMAIKARVTKTDFEAEINNNDVTPIIQPMREITVRVGKRGPYVGETNKYFTSPTDEVEAKLVNAWLNQREEFRVPTLDQQLEELQELRDWFAQLKADMQQYADKQDKLKPSADTMAKYDRLLKLEFDVGLALDSVPMHKLSIGQ